MRCGMEEVGDSCPVGWDNAGWEAGWERTTLLGKREVDDGGTARLDVGGCAAGRRAALLAGRGGFYAAGWDRGARQLRCGMEGVDDSCPMLGENDNASCPSNYVLRTGRLEQYTKELSDNNENRGMKRDKPLILFLLVHPQRNPDA